MKNKKIYTIGITFIAILTAGILTKQEFFLMIPLFISLFIMAYQAEANRYAILAGSMNSLIYTAAYLYMGVYGTAASAFLFSFPMQLWTFFSWRKRAYKKTVVFRRMSNKVRSALLISYVIIWTAMAFIFTKMDYEYAILDSAAFLNGFAIPILTLLAYVEYTYLNIFNVTISLFLTTQMTINDNGRITYLIYTIYGAYTAILAFINVQNFYKEQKAEKIEEDNGVI